MFTPLLSGTAVGTLEFQNILELVRHRHYPDIHFMQAWADDVNFNTKTLIAEESFMENLQQVRTTTNAIGSKEITEQEKSKFVNARKGKIFRLQYDKLVVAVRACSHAFGTTGVGENAYFSRMLVMLGKSETDYWDASKLPHYLLRTMA